LLFLGEEGTLASIAEDDKPLDAFNAAEPGTKALNGVIVD
jgi:hypothetical protein